MVDHGAVRDDLTPHDDDERGTGGRPAAADGQWLVSLPAVGEDLATRAVFDRTVVLVFGSPRKRDTRKLETRLWNLLEEAHAEASMDPVSRAIPATLHHILTRLLSWLTEIDGNKAKGRMSALVLFDSEYDVAFAHIGGVTPLLALDGEPVEVEWVAVEDRKGRAAHSFSMYARDDLDLELEWPLPSSAAGPRSVYAEWHGAEQAAAPAEPQLQLVDPHVSLYP